MPPLRGIGLVAAVLVGLRVQLQFFLDEVSPSLFGKPLLSAEPVISRVEKW